MHNSTRFARTSGFALAEVIVALTLLTVVVLSLAAVGGRLMAMGIATWRRTVATARLTSIADSLRSTSCLTIASGTDSSLGVRVDWRVTMGSASRSVVLGAAFADRSAHSLTAETLIPCD